MSTADRRNPHGGLAESVEPSVGEEARPNETPFEDDASESPFRAWLALPLIAAIFWTAFVVTAVVFPSPHPSEARLAALTAEGKKLFRPDQDMRLYAGSLALTIGAGLGFASRRKGGSPAPLDSRSSGAESIEPAPRHWNLLGTILAPALLAGLVFPCNADGLAAASWGVDNFHHVHFYAIAPLAHLAGGHALASEGYAQYGLMWPLTLWSAIMATSGDPYTTFFRLESVVLAGHAVSAYWLVRRLTGSGARAFVAAIAVLVASHELVEGIPVWIFPSSTPMRYPLEYVLPLLFANHSGGGWRGAMLLGAGLGMSWGIAMDAGLYPCAAACVLTFGVAAESWGARLRSVCGMTAGFVMVAMPILVLACGVEVLSPSGPGQLFEALRLYTGGIGALPLSEVPAGWLALFVACLTILTVGFVRGTARVSAGRNDGAALAFLSLTGFFSLSMFANRSHQENLIHALGPPLLVLVVLAPSFAKTIPFLSTVPAAWSAIKGLVCGCAFFGAIASPEMARVGAIPNALRISLKWPAPKPTARHLEYTDFVSWGRRFEAEILDLERDGHRRYLIGTDTTHLSLLLNRPPAMRFTPMIPLVVEQRDRCRADLMALKGNHLVLIDLGMNVRSTFGDILIEHWTLSRGPSGCFLCEPKSKGGGASAP
jgi:hypothetical protein